MSKLERNLGPFLLWGLGSIIRVANNTTIKIARILEANQKQNVNIGLTKGKVFSKVSPKMPPGST